MLNITNNKRVEVATLHNHSAIKQLDNQKHFKFLNKFLLGFSIFSVLVLFLPWTQNVSGSGAVTTLKPNQRPQTIQSLISGRIENGT